MEKGRMPRLACGPFLYLLLLSCSQSSHPTADDNRELENAAEMLDQAPGSLNAIDENALGEPPAEQAP